MENGIEFAAVADGVGSCDKSAEGARYVCELVLDVLTKEKDYLFSQSARNIGSLVVNYLQKKLCEKARAEGSRPTDYASTLSFVCLNKESGMLMTFVLGDSYIYTCKDGKTQRLGGNGRREGRPFSTMTEGSDANTHVCLLDGADVDSLWMCTDGAWSLSGGADNLSDWTKKAIENCDFSAMSGEYDKIDNADDCTFVLCRLSH